MPPRGVREAIRCRYTTRSGNLLRVSLPNECGIYVPSCSERTVSCRTGGSNDSERLLRRTHALSTCLSSRAFVDRGMVSGFSSFAGDNHRKGRCRDTYTTSVTKTRIIPSYTFHVTYASAPSFGTAYGRITDDEKHKLSSLWAPTLCPTLSNPFTRLVSCPLGAASYPSAAPLHAASRSPPCPEGHRGVQRVHGCNRYIYSQMSKSKRAPSIKAYSKCKL
jgi:hypothetical protein